MNPRAQTILYGIGTFLLPVVILMAAAAINGIEPFGPEMFINADMRTQYIDFFAWYRDVLLGNEDLFYSTSQALGNNMLPTFGYYLASPFNLLLPFFAERDIPLFCFIVTLLKVGCIQLTIQFFLRRRFNLNHLWSTTLGLGFALSLWTVTQLRNPMWLDGLIWLPLAAWGVCCLLRQGRWRFLAASYGACVLTSWYMGYMIGLFLCLYILFEGYVLGYEGVSSSGKTHQKRLLTFCGTMATGLALSAVVFLPCVMAMLSNGTTQGGHVKFSKSHEIIADRFPVLANVPMEVIIGGIACAVLAMVALVFWLLRKRSLRERCAIILFAVLMLCLAGCLAMPLFQQGSALDVIEALFLAKWEFEHTPQLFASFFTLGLAIFLFCTKRIPTKVKLACGLFLLLLILSSWLSPLRYIWGGLRIPAGYHSRMAFLLIFMLTWCAAYALRSILSAGSASKLSRFFAKVPVATVALVLVFAGVLFRTTVTWYYFYDGYYQAYIDDYMEDARTQVAELEQRDPGVYRVEKTYWRFGEGALNEGMSLGVNQISSYTSTGDQNVMAFLSDLGFGDDHFYTYGNCPSLVGESLLGVKYISSDAPPQGFVDAGLSPIELPEARFYENPYALALAYGVPAAITDFHMPEGTRWECLDALANAVCGYQVDPYPDTTALENSAVEQAIDWESFTNAIDQLRQHQFNFEEFGGSRISGTIDAEEGQMLLMTIPNQDGWSVTVNREAVTPQDVANGALMAIPVQPGMNQVEMRFTPPGLIPGAALSVIALLIIVFAPRLRMRWRSAS